MKKDFDPLRLPPELWLEIFMKNTELDDPSHYRLKTARHCSQVCQLWRTMLLSSSSTWGRLIVLHEFERTADEWKELILARVGNALLWIYGQLSSSTLQFFLTVVDRKWENVQVFDVWQNTGPHLSPETAAYLGKPAPNLEVFSLQHYSPLVAPETSFNLNMFSNVAPRLRRFHLPAFLFDVNSTLSWIPNLRAISFHEEYSRDAIFSALKAMPRIEFIDVDLRPRTVEPLPRDFTPFHLPRLRGLRVYGGYMPDALPFLELIKPSDQMSFVVIDPAYDQDLADTIEDLSSRYHHALIPWVLSYMKCCAPRFLLLETGPARCLRIRDYPPLISILSFKRRALDVDFFFDGHCHSALAKLGAASGSFSSVEKLLIGFGNDQEALIPLYEAFTSVTELTLEALYIDIPINIPILHAEREQKQSVLFPQLRILRITFEPGTPADTAYLPQAFDYVEYRARVGLPLSCLDLSDCNPWELSESNKERLGKLTGMSVKLSVVSVE